MNLSAWRGLMDAMCCVQLLGSKLIKSAREVKVMSHTCISTQQALRTWMIIRPCAPRMSWLAPSLQAAALQRNMARLGVTNGIQPGQLSIKSHTASGSTAARACTLPSVHTCVAAPQRIGRDHAITQPNAEVLSGL